MPSSAPMSYEDENRDSVTVRWIIIFVLLSLAAHALFLIVMIFLSKHIPAPKLESPTAATAVTLTIVPPPPVALPPKPKKIFMTTPAQPNAPHKETQVESNNDAQLASQSKKSRQDSIMPDVVSPDTHASSLQASPSAPPAKPQEAQTTPPAPKAEPSKQPPTPPSPPQPPQPKTEPTKTQTPPQPTKTPPPPKPAPTPPKVPPPPALNDDGLPVLPALTASTIAPQPPANQPQQVAAPPPMMPVVPANVQGRAGMSGQPSPDAMKTDLGMYKALFYQAVGSRWYQKVGQQMQLIGVGTVRVQYTISPEGLVTTRVIDGGGGSMQILLSLSVLSIRDVSPFRPFPPSMLKDYPNGYTDDFSFSIY